MRPPGWAVCRFSRMLRSCVEQALRLRHVAAPHGLFHLVQHAVEVVLRDRAVRLGGFWSFCLAAVALHALGELAQEAVHAWRSSWVRRLISSWAALRSSASRRRSWAARNSRSASDRPPSSICRPWPEQSATSTRSGSPLALRKRSRRCEAQEHAPLRRVALGRDQQRVERESGRGAGRRDRGRSCGAARRARLASGLVKGRCGRMKSMVSLRPSCSASSLASERQLHARPPRDAR